MSTYLALKWLHIVSSVVLVGTGFGSAFYLFFANRQPSLEARVVVSRLVVRADLWFTTPAVILQPLTGVALVRLAGWPWDSPWLLTAIALYALAGACWLPVLWLQWRMVCLAEYALHTGRPLPPAYVRLQRAWEWLGYPAFAAMLAIYGLMVFKPPLWT